MCASGMCCLPAPFLTTVSLCCATTTPHILIRWGTRAHALCPARTQVSTTSRSARCSRTECHTASASRCGTRGRALCNLCVPSITARAAVQSLPAPLCRSRHANIVLHPAIASSRRVNYETFSRFPSSLPSTHDPSAPQHTFDSSAVRPFSPADGVRRRPALLPHHASTALPPPRQAEAGAGGGAGAALRGEAGAAGRQGFAERAGVFAKAHRVSSSRSGMSATNIQRRAANACLSRLLSLALAHS